LAKTFEDKLHNTLTYFRFPLVLIFVLLIMSLIKDYNYFWIGAVISVVGEAIQCWASSQIHKEQKLTVSGPYSYVRNPMYIGRFFVFMGLFIMTKNPYLILAYLALFCIYAQIRVKREEAKLITIFGEDYDHFCNEIHRWLPSFKAYSKAVPQRASYEQLCVNHENINAMVVIGALILIYVRIYFQPILGKFLPF
jgi:protein-S-isoprenylcysteine O-methyltransferase Ste14